jgi:hypothetical protein
VSNNKKRKFQIEPNSLSKAEENSTRNVLRRLRNPSESLRGTETVEKDEIQPEKFEAVERVLPIKSDLIEDSPANRGDQSIGVTTQPNKPTHTTGNTHTTGQPRKIKEQPVSPKRDFTKVPNSITRIVQVQGLFKGKSKQIWDYIWQTSRGAVIPKRSVHLTNAQIMEGSGVGSKNTIAAGIKHLETLQLIKRTPYQKGNVGNIYEAFMPEEVGITIELGLPNLTGHPTLLGSPDLSGDPTQKLGSLGIPEKGYPTHAQTIEDKSTSQDSKTSLKTLKYVDDDALIINVLEQLNEAARKLTGKDLTKKDLEKLSDITELLINETVIAAARTGTISALVPFMTENLRRRLYSKPRSTSKKDIQPAHLNVGKGSEAKSEEEISWTPQTPLTLEQRQSTLNALREAKEADTIFFREFTTYGEIEYTPEDFSWLLEQLEDK